MSTIITRAGKGSPLTNNEVDANFTNLNTDKAELSGAAFTGAITTTSTVDGRDVATDGSKLDGIEAGATADQTAAEIKTAYESNADTNAFTDADESKLDGIEASADVTDTTNVTAAGALMDSELTSIASVKALNQGVATTDSPTFAGLTSTGEITANGGIALGNNDIATFGASDNLQIYSDGTNSFIKEIAGAGSLIFNADFFTVQNAAGTETKLVAKDNAEVQLYYDNLVKLATTSTGIDVTGTATMDGLTVDGAATVSIDTNATRSVLKLESSGTSSRVAMYDSGGSTRVDSSLGGYFVRTGGLTTDTFAESSITRFGIASNGDISFYEDTGTTAKLFWDASAGNVGIGTSSPVAPLHVKGTTNGNLLVRGGSLAVSGLTGTALTSVNDAVSATTPLTLEGSEFNFVQSNAVKVKVDSAGNVGIGETSPLGKLHIKGTDVGATASAQGNSLVLEDSENGLSILSSTAGAGYINFGDSDDNNVGMIIYGHSSNSMNFWTNAAERMRIDSAGNVGIGTSSPSAGLELNLASGDGLLINSADIATIKMKNTGGGVTNWGFATTNLAAGDFGIYASNSVGGDPITAGTPKLYFTSAGNVGIGTSSPASPTGFGSSGILHLKGGTGNDCSIVLEGLSGSGGRQEIGASGGALQFYRGAATGSMTESMRIDSAGNLLVGKTSNTISAAGAKLGTGGSNFTRSGEEVVYFNRTTNDGNIATFAKDGTTVGSISSVGGADIKVVLSSDGDQYITGNSAANYMSFSAANQERMRIDSAGSLLVGGTAYPNGTDTNWGVNAGGVQASSRTTTATAIHYTLYNSNGAVGSISTNGSATSFNTSSDERLKENITDADDAGSKIDAIQVRQYDWKADGAHQDYGMIAQELQTVAPEAVSVPEDSEDMMGVDYSKLVPMLVKEIQSLRNRVAQLEE